MAEVVLCFGLLWFALARPGYLPNPWWDWMVCFPGAFFSFFSFVEWVFGFLCFFSSVSFSVSFSLSLARFLSLLFFFFFFFLNFFYFLGFFLYCVFFFFLVVGVVE